MECASRDVLLSFVFFFQAEDGIRDLYVTGVQTCALPIYCSACHKRSSASCGSRARTSRLSEALCSCSRLAATCAPMYPVDPVRNIATLLRLSLFLQFGRSWERLGS